MRDSTNIEARHDAHHVAVCISQGERVLGYRLMDLATEYNPLIKELACRAVATNPSLAGRPWHLNARPAASDAPEPALALETRAADGSAGPGRPLVTMRVPVSHFAWVAAIMARQLSVEGTYTYHVGPLEPTDPIVARWHETESADADFEILPDEEPSLRLPTAFVPGEPPGPRRVLDRRPSWTRCLLAAGVRDTFFEAARAERRTERHWAGAGRTFLTPAACYVLIDELVELPPAEAGKCFVVTHGRGSRPIRERLGDRLNAHLHLHPRFAEDQPMTPTPSAPDSTVAWNLDQASPNPCCFPIALFEMDPSDPAGDVAVHAYERGLLVPVQLEVLGDE